MQRASSAALLVGLLVLGIALAPAASSGNGLVVAQRVAADGTVERVPARVLDLEAPAYDPLGPMLLQEPAAPEEPTLNEILAAEKQRPTRTITFYGHVFGLGLVPQTRADGEFGPNGPQAANTIFPHGDANLGLGFFDWCTEMGNFVGLPPTPAPDTGCDDDPRNKVALFLTAGPVQVHQPEDFLYSKLHNERGRTKDIVLDPAGKITASLWMSLDAHSWSVGNGVDDTNCVVALPPDIGCPYPYWGWDPAIWPGYVVEAKLYSVELGEYGQGASEPPPIFESWAAGAMTLIAEGQVGPQDVTNGLPGSPNVHEFVVDLGSPQVQVIPKTHDVVLVYSFYSIIAGQKVSIHNWRVWAGELFPAKFTLPVKNAVDVELVIPQFIHDKLLVHSVIASAFGSYDVDVSTAELTILGPDSESPVEPQTIERIGDYQVAHGAHFKPVNITWIWDYKADRIRPGTYKVQVEACNQQGSACEMTEGSFTLDANLRPTAVVVGRSGQRTVSDAQLDQITSGGAAVQGATVTEADAPLRVAKEAAKPAPGFEVLALAAALGAALLVQRRWGK